MKYNQIATVIIPGLLVLSLAACNGGGSANSTPKISFATLNYSNAAPGSSTGLTGIRQVYGSTDVYITGNYVESISNGTLYKGPVTGGGTYYIYNVPDALANSVVAGTTVGGTNVYSAASNESAIVQLTGSYSTVQLGESHAFGFLYTGPVSNNSQTVGVWESINYPSAQTPDHSTVENTIPHSIMGNLIVGNYDTNTLNGNAFIYDMRSKTYNTIVISPGAKLTTIYGVWANGGEDYTIAGGYSGISESGLAYAFIADYDAATPGTAGVSNINTYTFNNVDALDTHFEGITTDGSTGYNLAAGWLQSGLIGAAFAHVSRNADGGFESAATWINVAYPNASTTGDTVYQNYLLGEYSLPNESGVNGYVATIPTSWY